MSRRSGLDNPDCHLEISSDEELYAGADMASLFENSSGGKQKLGRISKMGNRNLRKLLVVGAHAVLFHRKPHTDPLRMWAKRLLEKKPFKLVAVALANKMARIAFAIMRSKTVYREIPA